MIDFLAACDPQTIHFGGAHPSQRMTDNSEPNRAILGVDIGGTKVAVGLVDIDGTILAQGRTPMVAKRHGGGCVSSGNTRDRFHVGNTGVGAAIWLGISQHRNLRARSSRSEDRSGSRILRIFPAGGIFRWPRKSSTGLPLTRQSRQRRQRSRASRNSLGSGPRLSLRFLFHDRNRNRNRNCSGWPYLPRKHWLGGRRRACQHRLSRAAVCNCGKLGCIEILAAGPAIGTRARAKLAANPSHHSAILELAKGDVAGRDQRIGGQAFTQGIRSRAKYCLKRSSS